MLRGYEKFRIIDKHKDSEFYAEVNWSDDPRIDNCKVVRFTFPDGKQIVVDKKNLLAMLFAMGETEEQMKMVPQKITNIRWYETILGITATKDIRKGEKINVPVKLTLPADTREVIKKVGKPASGFLTGM